MAHVRSRSPRRNCAQSLKMNHDDEHMIPPFRAEANDQLFANISGLCAHNETMNHETTEEDKQDTALATPGLMRTVVVTVRSALDGKVLLQECEVRRDNLLAEVSHRLLQEQGQDVVVSILYKNKKINVQDIINDNQVELSAVFIIPGVVPAFDPNASGTRFFEKVGEVLQIWDQEQAELCCRMKST